MSLNKIQGSNCFASNEPINLAVKTKSKITKLQKQTNKLTNNYINSNMTTTTTTNSTTTKAPILVQINEKVYDFANFAERHPGGEQVVKFLHLRDGTIPVENHHRKDVHVQKMLKVYECKDEPLLKKARSEISPMAPIDKALLELNRRNHAEGTDTVPPLQALWWMLRPLLEFVSGMALIICYRKNSAVAYWLGFFLIYLAAKEGLFMGHEYHHQTMFQSSKANRFAAAWHGLLVCGLHLGATWREHGGHHAHTNIADADSALNVPIIRWRKDQVTKPDWEDNYVLSRLNRAVVMALGFLAAPVAAFLSGLGSQPWLPWYANLQDDRMVTKWTIAALVIRPVLMTYLVGPMAAILAPYLAFMVSSFAATINHFDQPVVLPSEVHEKQWTYTRMQLEAEYGFEESSKWVEVFFQGTCEHQYHHFLPNVHNAYLGRSETDYNVEVDSFLRDFGLEIKQRTIGEATRDAFSVYYNMPTAASTTETTSFDSASSEGGAGYGLVDGSHKIFEKLRSEKIDFLRRWNNKSNCSNNDDATACTALTEDSDSHDDSSQVAAAASALSISMKKNN